MTHANGVTTTYTYHPGNQLRTLTTTRPGNVQEYVLAYRIDKSGLRTQVAQLQDTFTRATYDYEYDKVKRLTGEYVFLPAGRSRTVNWTYDKVGNRLTEARTGVRTANSAYSYDANDRLTQHTTSGTAPDVGTTTYAYDAAGNLTQKTSPQGTENYVYDDANRMVELIAANQEVTRYAYNHNGIRIKQTKDATGSNPQTAHYLVDPNQAYAQVVEEHAQVGSNPKTLAALYTFGDDRISQYRPANGATPATVRHYHADGLGSTRLLTDSAGVVTDRYFYEAFGELEAGASVQASDNSFLYTGEQLDPNSGFYYLRARYMNPGDGRFTQQDPYEGAPLEPLSLHKYVYTSASPISNRDPSGLVTLGEINAGIVNTMIRAAQATATFGNVAAQVGARAAMQLVAHTVRVAVQVRPYVTSMPKIGAQMGRVLSRLFGHFQRFVKSKAFQKAGKHEIELWGPSPAVKTPEVVGPKIAVIPKVLSLELHNGGCRGEYFSLYIK
ncbi:RHS repeat domain-containing protein [Tahibacter soli]|uniref:Teneurin-like YD-shell domain-containing protein n=1 Tax=Tahibacter soli TaxID=2983605 RepID=A0A9X3YKE2_9GAMM|nr:RHS repeat-associated core domain-containing protein [Tahibacter soli]MDC8014001.1 hypothetical protein [Tahibacter soli]